MWHTQMNAVTGRGHRAKALPCQDRTWSLQEGDMTVIALADGAGSAPLSQEGAEIAVRTACQVLCRQFDVLHTTASPQEMRRAVLEEVLEKLRARAAELHADVADLACTLLAVAVRGDEYLLFHVGDGVIGYQKNGTLLVASAPQNGEFANTTTFVTAPAAWRNARVLRGSQPQIEGFLLMSDGCEPALYQKKKNTLAPFVKRLFQRTEFLEPQMAAEMLEAIMEGAISRRTRDDCSVAIATRGVGTLCDWTHLQQREQAAVLGIITGNRNRRRRLIRKYIAQGGVCVKSEPK